MNNLLERREFQGRPAAITNCSACFGRGPVKFSQPLRENFDFCGVTSFSADFLMLNVTSLPCSVSFVSPPLHWNAASMFLPAAGIRDNNGNVNNVGDNGNYWSSNTNGINGRNLNFNDGNFNAANNNNRANGFSVRCVQALNNNDSRFSDKNCHLKYDLFRAYFDARKHKRNTWNQLRFEIEFEHNLLQMYEKILNGTYEIRKSIAFIITDPVMREILAADFSDRVVHHLIFNYINPILDQQFIPDSYSCRTGKGTHYGIKRIAGFLKACSENYTKDCYILKLDIKGYFMGMNKHLLVEKLHNMLDAERNTTSFDFNLVWWLIEKVIWNDPTQSCIIKGKMSDWDGLPLTKRLFQAAPNCGLPIGNLTSQLFSNVYLHDFDCFVKNELGIEYYGRYVDDFVIIHPDKAFLLDVLPKIRQYLLEHSQLQLHPNKIYLQHYSKGVAFLGAYIKPHRCYINNRTKRKFYGALKEIDEILTQSLSPSSVVSSRSAAFVTPSPNRVDLEKVRAKLNSYLGIMKHYRTYNIKRKALLRPNKFYEYGYLENRLNKYSISRKHLKRITN